MASSSGLGSLEPRGVGSGQGRRHGQRLAGGSALAPRGPRGRLGARPLSARRSDSEASVHHLSARLPSLRPSLPSPSPRLPLPLPSPAGGVKRGAAPSLCVGRVSAVRPGRRRRWRSRRGLRRDRRPSRRRCRRPAGAARPDPSSTVVAASAVASASPSGWRDPTRPDPTPPASRVPARAPPSACPPEPRGPLAGP